MHNFSKNLRFLRENRGLRQEDFEPLGIKKGTLSNYELGKTEPKLDLLNEISKFFRISVDELLNVDLEKNSKDFSKDFSKVNMKNGNLNGDQTEEKEKEEYKKAGNTETRPRIPLNAAAGTLTTVVDGLSADYCEEIPVIRAFSAYDFTIFARGESMEPEFHSGDELACLRIKNNDFIQWGRFHVLDTSQGLIVKRIFNNDEYIICRSEESELYPDFRIHKSDVYGLALVIGLIRRF